MKRIAAFLRANAVALVLLALLLAASALDSCKRSEVYAMDMPILVRDTQFIPFVSNKEKTNE